MMCEYSYRRALYRQSLGGFKFQVLRVNDGASASSALPGVPIAPVAWHRAGGHLCRTRGNRRHREPNLADPSLAIEAGAPCVLDTAPPTVHFSEHRGTAHTGPHRSSRRERVTHVVRIRALKTSSNLFVQAALGQQCFCNSLGFLCSTEKESLQEIYGLSAKNVSD